MKMVNIDRMLIKHSRPSLYLIKHIQTLITFTQVAEYITSCLGLTRLEVFKMDTKLIRTIVITIVIIYSKSVKVRNRFNWQVINSHDIKTLF